MANTKVSDMIKNNINPNFGRFDTPKGELVKDELWLINRWESWNKAALTNTRNAIKKANADLKILNLEKDLIRNIKKKWKS